MDDQIRSLEVSVIHLTLLLRLHKRSIENFPDEYSDSFKNGQRLILEDAIPQLMDIQNQITRLKEVIKDNELITRS